MANNNYAHTQNGSSETPGVGYVTDEHELTFAEKIVQYYQKHASPKSSLSVVVYHPIHRPASKTQRIPKESTLVVKRI
ncbi:MAG: hypothetical protein WCI72_00085 [archaeon]